jgi:hypothetical protein
MKLFWRVFLPVLILISGLGIESCSGPVTLSEATMCFGLDNAMRPINPTLSFEAGASEINVSAKIANAPRNTEVRAELFYIKGAANTTNKLVSASRANVEGTTYIGFTFTRGSIGAWPIGEYRVDLYVKSEKISDLFFKTTN